MKKRLLMMLLLLCLLLTALTATVSAGGLYKTTVNGNEVSARISILYYCNTCKHYEYLNDEENVITVHNI